MANKSILSQFEIHYISSLYIGIWCSFLVFFLGRFSGSFPVVQKRINPCIKRFIKVVNMLFYSLLSLIGYVAALLFTL